MCSDSENEWIYKKELDELNKSISLIKKYFEKSGSANIIIESVLHDIKTNMKNLDNISKSAHLIASDNAYAIRRIERVIEELTGKKIDKKNTA